MRRVLLVLAIGFVVAVAPVYGEKTEESKGGKPTQAPSQSLTQGEVIRIAEVTAKTEGFDIAKYNMTGCHYEYTKEDKSWTVFFTLKPPTPPGGHFAVSVDDQTKKARLIRGK